MISLIVGRELRAYFRQPFGYIVMAAVLVVDGLLFNAWAIGSGQRLSSEVLETFFYSTSGCVLLASIFIAMPLFAEERQNNTLMLLETSILKDYQIVLGKYFSGLIFLSLITLLTFYMPLLILINGKVSFAHIVAGYLGLFLLGGAALALGLLCSVVSPNQLVSVILSALIVAVFVLFWLLSRIASPPIDEIIAYLAIHDQHFQPFMRGLVSTKDIIFYLSLIYLALLTSTRILESRRWH
ncbi:MAG: hypothetical protein CMH60_01345 [Myxococcales bacterium]|nr:hypothetical protein [Myxococcales bacterium]